MESLCKELGISFNELLNGEVADRNEEIKEVEKLALEALQEVEKIKEEKALITGIFSGILLIILGTGFILYSKVMIATAFLLRLTIRYGNWFGFSWCICNNLYHIEKVALLKHTMNRQQNRIAVAHMNQIC